jgi:hypothetical protein
MDRLDMIMHLTTICTSYIAIMLVSHNYIFAIDTMNHQSQYQSRAVTTSKTKASPGASNHHT